MRLSVRRLLPAAVALAVTAGCGLARTTPTGTAATPDPATTTSTATTPTTSTEPASYDVATRVLKLRDSTRSTGHSTGRSLPTTLFYPATGRGPFPVVVFTHGFLSDPDTYRALLTGWAAAGFVVAAPSYPLTRRGSAGVLDDVDNQPADVRFVLGRVLALDQTPNDPLDGRIDTRHVAAAGHSAGAVTTLGLLTPCCADSRITAALVLTGSAQRFGTHFTTPGVPTLVLHGTDDDVIAPAEGRRLYAALPAPKAFVSLLGGTHSAPYDTATDPHFPTVLAVTTDFLRLTLDGREDAAAALRTDANRRGLAELSDDRLSH